MDLIDDEDEDVNIFIFGYDVVFVRDEYLSFFEELGVGFNKDWVSLNILFFIFLKGVLLKTNILDFYILVNGGIINSLKKLQCWHFKA